MSEESTGGIVVTLPAGATVTPIQDRLTMLLAIHLEHHQDKAESVAFNGSVNLTHQQQLYGPRRMSVGLKPQRLDIGWIENPGYVMVENRAGKKLTTRPTLEQEQEIAQQLVYLYCEGDRGRVIVRPGRFVLVEFEYAAEVLVVGTVDKTPIEISCISQ